MTDKEIFNKRRNLSGIYIRETLPQDAGEWKPTCIEDCTPGKQYEWISGRAAEECGHEFMKNLAQRLTETMGRLRAMFTEEERLMYGNIMSYVDVSEYSSDEHKIAELMRMCKAIKFLACAMGVENKVNEED